MAYTFVCLNLCAPLFLVPSVRSIVAKNPKLISEFPPDAHPGKFPSSRADPASRMMSPDQLVSVIVPTYNCASYIAMSIRSALEQDYPYKEIIVVDDGSTDTTLQELKQFGDRIRVILQNNSGAAIARNAAIAAAKGSFFAFLDSDDLWLPGKLTAQMKYLTAHPDVGMVYSGWAEWHSDRDGQFGKPPSYGTPANELQVEPNDSGWIYNRLLHDCIVHTTTALIRREIATQAGEFDPELRRGQDYDYWLRVSRLTRIDKLATVYSLYRIHNASVTRQPLPTNYRYVVIKRALDKWGRTGPDGTETPQSEIDALMAQIWYGFGYLHRMSGDRAIARDAFRKALGYRLLWPSAWINWVRTLV
jgi:glycosyltransferase involved in cell wall biosynthesis